MSNNDKLKPSAYESLSFQISLNNEHVSDTPR